MRSARRAPVGSSPTWPPSAWRVSSMDSSRSMATVKPSVPRCSGTTPALRAPLRAFVDELGGASEWASAVGSVPVASFTITKWRWLCDNEPDLADRVERILLPHDWLTWRLTGEAVTDRGDVSGTGWWGHEAYRTDLLALAGRGLTPALPQRARATRSRWHDSRRRAGRSRHRRQHGRRARAGRRPGEVVVSMGTSGTVFAVATEPTSRRDGRGSRVRRCHGSVASTRVHAELRTSARRHRRPARGQRRRTRRARPLRTARSRTDSRCCRTSTVSAHRTGRWRRALSLGSPGQTSRPRTSPAAAVEGVLCGLADALDALRAAGAPASRALLVGGAARSRAVQAVAPSLLGLPVSLPSPAEYVALGAARQAAWVLAGSDDRPSGCRRCAVELAAPDGSSATTCESAMLRFVRP